LHDDRLRVLDLLAVRVRRTDRRRRTSGDAPLVDRIRLDRTISPRIVAPGGADGEHDAMTSTNQSTRITRAFVRFQNNPSSVRYAAAAIISTIVVLVVLGAVMMRLLASEQYDTFGDALWFTLQTVTTVGYGDNTPTSGEGRVVATIVMLVSIGLISVITAAVTSMFIRSVGRDEQEADRRVLAETLARIESKLAEAHERLERIEHGAATSTADRDD
jgi:hypothetical protein